MVGDDLTSASLALLSFDLFGRNFLFLQRVKSEKYWALHLQLALQFFEEQMRQTHNFLFCSVLKRPLRSSLLSTDFISRAEEMHMQWIIHFT